MKYYIKGILIVFFFFIIALLFFSKNAVEKSYPKINGDVFSKSLKNEVKIFRDNLGIPFIEAKNEEEAYFALGYCHAQDRLWQMDIIVRICKGKLSEIMGRETIEIDKLSHLIGLNELAQNLFNNSSEETKKSLIAYSKGVNQSIQDMKGNYPIEFDILSYEPETWEPYYSFLIQRFLAWTLNLSWWIDGTYARISSRVDQNKFSDLIPKNFNDYFTLDDVSTKKSTTKNQSKLIEHSYSLKLLTEVSKKINKFLGLNFINRGSNCWIINSKLSQNNYPMIANDTHLPYTLPSIWYLASLNYPDNKVVGVTIPGCPAIVIGRNEYIAWGMTNLMLDDCDFFEESIDLKKETFINNNQEQSLIVRFDTINIKLENPIIYKYYATNNGPVLYNFDNKIVKTQNNKFYSIKWTGFNLSDEFSSYFKINKSRNISEFREALRTFNVPAQNFFCIDKSDNILYQVAGFLPIRDYNPILIQNATNSNNWKGFISFDNLPYAINPENNFLANCNNPPSRKISELVGNIYEPPSRFERIKFLLSQNKKFSADDFKAFQNDFNSPYAKKIVIHILNAFNKVKINDQNLETVLTYFRNWNYEINKYDQVSIIFEYFLNELIKNTFKDEMGDELFNDFVFLGNIPLIVIEQLLNKNNSIISDTLSFNLNTSNSWFDNINTDKVEDKNSIIRKSLVDAIVKLENEFDRKPEKWYWGKIHLFELEHPLSKEIKSIENISNIGPVAVDGDQTTLFNSGYPICNSYKTTVGPTVKFISNLADDFIYIVIPSGQSGQIGSIYYKNQFLQWSNKKYFKIPVYLTNKINYNCLTIKPI